MKRKPMSNQPFVYVTRTRPPIPGSLAARRAVPAHFSVDQPGAPYCHGENAAVKHAVHRFADPRGTAAPIDGK